MSGRMLVILVLWPLACGKPSSPQTPSMHTRVKQMNCGATSPNFADSIDSPNGKYTVLHQVVMAGRDSVEVRPTAGGGPVLTFTGGIMDLYWLPGSDGIVYSVAPIYDPPGIFLRRIGSTKITTLVGPQIKDSVYPDGADFIRLCGVQEVDSTTWIEFARFGDVAKIDFKAPPAPVIQRVQLRRPK